MSIHLTVYRLQWVWGWWGGGTLPQWEVCRHNGRILLRLWLWLHADSRRNWMQRFLSLWYSLIFMSLHLTLYRYQWVWGRWRGGTLPQWEVCQHNGRILLRLWLWLHADSRQNWMQRFLSLWYSSITVGLISLLFSDADECQTDDMCPMGMECVEEDSFFTCQPRLSKSKNEKSRSKNKGSKSKSKSKSRGEEEKRRGRRGRGHRGRGHWRRGS